MVIVPRMASFGPSILAFANVNNRVQEGIIFVTMDKHDLASARRYPFSFEGMGDGDDNDDDDNELEDSEDGDLNDFEFTPLEPCEYSPALRSSESSSFHFDPIESGEHTEDKHIEPSARFKIRRDDRGSKMKATLTFEPALYAVPPFSINPANRGSRSGRFILARFCSPSRQDNIDIQFIGAYGYVGRRFFPAVSPR